MLGRSSLVAVLVITPAIAASPQAEGFKKLNGSQIRKTFLGKEFSDDVHFSFRYLPGGTVQGMSMGKKVTSKWTIAKDQLCVTDNGGERCYDVWKKGSAVRLLIGESDLGLEGSLQ